MYEISINLKKSELSNADNVNSLLYIDITKNKKRIDSMYVAAIDLVDAGFADSTIPTVDVYKYLKNLRN